MHVCVWVGGMFPGELPDLKVVGLGGEKMNAQLIKAWAPHLRCLTINYISAISADVKVHGDILYTPYITVLYLLKWRINMRWIHACKMHIFI